MQLVPKVKVSVVYNIGPNILTMQSLIQKNNPFMIRFCRKFFGFAPLIKNPIYATDYLLFFKALYGGLLVVYIDRFSVNKPYQS